MADRTQASWPLSRVPDRAVERHWSSFRPSPTLFLLSETSDPSEDVGVRAQFIQRASSHCSHVVCFWKRAQILVAETWAAFFPADPSAPHPIFPNDPGARISSLTMFADYRVPQILHHLGVLVYPPSLREKLINGENIPPGSDEEISLRAASIVSVERMRDEILRVRGGASCEEVSSVLIDFYLWDLAKGIEAGQDRVEGIESVEILPGHRTRSIWY